MEPDVERTVAFFRFEDLRVYHKALDYINWVHTTVKMLPQDTETAELSRQFLNAAQAIALNIAEGSARNKSQFVYYLKMAKSAVRECVVYTTMASNREIISASIEDHSRNSLMEMTKMLGALIGSLQRTFQNHGDHDMDNDSSH